MTQSAYAVIWNAINMGGRFSVRRSNDVALRVEFPIYPAELGPKSRLKEL